MKIKVKVAITVYEEYAEKLAVEEFELRNKLKPHIVGNNGELIGDIYEVEYDSPIYKDIIKFGENIGEVNLLMEYIYKYDEEELKKAKMFWLNPSKCYIQSKEYYEYPCSVCGCRILDDKADIKVGKKVKGGKSRRIFKFGSEIEELLCVSVDLYEDIIENGVNDDDFTPVYCGSTIQGYAFAPREEYDIRTSVYDYTKCPECGREYGVYNIEKGYDIETFELCENKDFLSHDAYRTKIYFDREQRILISPKLFNLIRNNINDDEYVAIF